MSETGDVYKNLEIVFKVINHLADRFACDLIVWSNCSGSCPYLTEEICDECLLFGNLEYNRNDNRCKRHQDCIKLFGESANVKR